MKIINEPYHRNNWTQALRELPVQSKALEAELKNYGSLRTIATKLQQKYGTKYSFETSGQTVKVWRIA